MDNATISNLIHTTIEKTGRVNYEYTYQHLRATIAEILESRRLDKFPKASIAAFAKSVAIACCHVDEVKTHRGKNTTKTELIQKNTQSIAYALRFLITDVADLRSEAADAFIKDAIALAVSTERMIKLSHIEGHGKGQSERRKARHLFSEVYKFFGIQATNTELVNLLWPIARNSSQEWIYKHLPTAVKNELIAIVEADKSMTRARENNQHTHSNHTAAKQAKTTQAIKGIETKDGLKQIKTILNAMDNREAANEIAAAIDDVLLNMIIG